MKVRDGALEFPPGSIAIKGKWEVITLTNHGYSELYGKPKDSVGQPTDELKAMMKRYNLSPVLSNYYRLKGAQVDFTDRTGRPTIVGNSITEAGFVSTSSCITCHARASIGAPSKGQNQFPVPPPLSVFTDHRLRLAPLILGI